MKLPCEDCIVFPLCKARYVFIFDSERQLDYFEIMHKCSLFEDWFFKGSILDVEKLFEVKRW